jgi:hypothetical protein
MPGRPAETLIQRCRRELKELRRFLREDPWGAAFLIVALLCYAGIIAFPKIEQLFDPPSATTDDCPR